MGKLKFFKNEKNQQLFESFKSRFENKGTAIQYKSTLLRVESLIENKGKTFDNVEYEDLIDLSPRDKMLIKHCFTYWIINDIIDVSSINSRIFKILLVA